MESRAQDRDAKVDWKELLDHNGVWAKAPNWNYHRHRGLFVNSNDSSGYVPATQITDGAFAYVLQHAFHPKNIGRWKKAMGIQAPMKNPVIQVPKPQAQDKPKLVPVPPLPKAQAQEAVEAVSDTAGSLPDLSDAEPVSHSPNDSQSGNEEQAATTAQS